jgi:hypothetical protein
MQNDAMTNTQLIKNGEVVSDSWLLLREISATDTAAAELPSGKIIVPANYWLEHRESLIARGDAAVWLGSDQAPALIADDLELLPLMLSTSPSLPMAADFHQAAHCANITVTKVKCAPSVNLFAINFSICRVAVSMHLRSQPAIRTPPSPALTISATVIKLQSISQCRIFADDK